MVTRHALSGFGLLGGAIQSSGVIWPERMAGRAGLLVLTLLTAIGYGVARVWPRRAVRGSIAEPQAEITVKVGDLFAEPTDHLVIGFTDTFDSDTTDGLVISERSVQGQFLDRVYGNDVVRLDCELEAALAGWAPVTMETPQTKPHGKLSRYPTGTVAVLGSPANHWFCVAYARMGNDLVARATLDQLWHSLGELWQSIHLRGQRRRVAMGIVGSELARISGMSRENLLKMIVLSFTARARQHAVCRELVIVIHPRDRDDIDMTEIAAFLRAL